ncbi:hypothetical protein [Nostoc sp.]|uniref:hypothetical protein n=1 Tax=Nostoc sp. TaxID=1180 RepID=UPI003FA5AE9D
MEYGFYGLAKAAAKVLTGKRKMILAVAVDQKGYAYPGDGLNTVFPFTLIQISARSLLTSVKSIEKLIVRFTN